MPQNQTLATGGMECQALLKAKEIEVESSSMGHENLFELETAATSKLIW